MSASSLYLSDSTLLKQLDLAIEFLQNQNKLQGADPKVLKEAVLKDFKEGNIPALKLNDVQNFALVLRFMVLNTHQKGPKVDFSKMFKDMSELNPEESKKMKEELQKELEAYLLAKLTEINKLLPKPERKTDKELEDMSKILADHFVNKRNDTLVKDDGAMAFLAALSELSEKKQMSEKELAYRNMYGGADPTKSGGEVTIVQELTGNARGFLNQTQGLATDMSQMAESGRYDSDRDDPMGMEFSNLMLEMGAGAIVDTQAEERLVDPLQSELSSQKLLPTSPGLTMGK